METLQDLLNVADQLEVEYIQKEKIDTDYIICIDEDENRFYFDVEYSEFISQHEITFNKKSIHDLDLPEKLKFDLMEQANRQYHIWYENKCEPYEDR